jgi:peptidoglycan/xylan/chitin deacetylase (PgdA/CDA1 family)
MGGPGVVFLMYHELELPGRPLSQSDPGYARYIVPQTVFGSQLQWLRQNDWRGLSVGEALGYPCGNSVAITFDDGCETDLIGAAPMLREHGCNATFYATVGFLGKAGHMSPAQLRQLSDLGFEIGCHSMTHAYLNDLDLPDLRREISDAGKELANIIGKRVDHFSCPGGRYDKRVLDIAREAGYRSLATSRAHANMPSTNPFMLGRVAITRKADLTFPQICNGAGLWKMQVRESLRGAARLALGNALYDRFRTLLLRP